MRSLLFLLSALLVATTMVLAAPDPQMVKTPNGVLRARQDCCEDPPGCGCPDFCSGACDGCCASSGGGGGTSTTTTAVTSNKGFAVLAGATGTAAV